MSKQLRKPLADFLSQGVTTEAEQAQWRAAARRLLDAYGAQEPPNFHGGTRWAPPVVDGTPEADKARATQERNARERRAAYLEQRPFHALDVPPIRGVHAASQSKRMRGEPEGLAAFFKAQPSGGSTVSTVWDMTIPAGHASTPTVDDWSDWEYDADTIAAECVAQWYAAPQARGMASQVVA